MSEATLPTQHINSEDAVWASLQTPYTEQQLHDFCDDIERLLRINPFVEFSQWYQVDENTFQVSGRNLSQQPAIEFEYRITRKATPDGWLLTYSDGLKSSTQIKLEATADGSKLTLIDDYSKAAISDRENRLNEVDKSLVNWANDIQIYLFTRQRWSWFAPWRWYMQRVWQPMKPSARRITYMLIWISVAELAFITLGFVIYWAEFT